MRPSGIATERGAEIVWTKIADASLMEVAANEDIVFAASPDGGFIWPDFLPAFDALVTLAKLLDLLAASQRRLSDVVRDLPRVSHRPRVGAHAVGAQGRGDARARGAGAARLGRA